jgi:hypothetical protein
MFNEKASSADTVAAGMTAQTGFGEASKGGGVFRVQCVGQDGRVKWEAESHNLVVTEGLQDMNAKYFGGSSYTASFYLGLITGPGSSTVYAAADTLASHAGWTEFTDYSGSRKAVTFGSASAATPSVISNSGSPSSFAITATGTVGGAFLCTVASGTSGLLFSEADFASPGDRNVVNGDTLNVTYTFSLDAA